MPEFTTDAVARQILIESPTGFELTIYWITDGAGAFAAVPIHPSIIDKIAGSSLYMLITDPGATAPTDNYGITLVDSLGADVLGGAGLLRDTANSEQAMPAIGAAYGPRPVNSETLTFDVTGNIVAGAFGTARFYFAK